MLLLDYPLLDLRMSSDVMHVTTRRRFIHGI